LETINRPRNSETGKKRLLKMTKNVLVLSSSPRRGGNSDLLCDQFIKGTQEAGHAAEKIFLKDKNINYCTGCGTCIDKGKSCPQKDDMPGILDKMIAADVIVMSTPVYFYTMSGQMKTLIDRTCARYTSINNKEFYFIVSAADNSIPAMERTLEGFRGFTYCLDEPKEMGIIYGTGAWNKGEIRGSEAMTEAYEMGRKV
jgi:multimeric flavodoxin WrbA